MALVADLPGGRVRRNADLIHGVGTAYAAGLKAMLGVDSIACGARCWWPSYAGGWTMVVCPLSPRHRGPHADENYVPLFTDDDAAWLATQRDLCTSPRLDGRDVTSAPAGELAARAGDVGRQRVPVRQP